MSPIAASDLFSLSIPERIQLVEDIWDSSASQPEMVVLTQDTKCELDKRLEACEQHPEEQSSWDEARSRLWQLV